MGRRDGGKEGRRERGTEGRREGRRDGGTEGGKERRRDGRTDGGTEGRREGRTDGGTDGGTTGALRLSETTCGAVGRSGDEEQLKQTRDWGPTEGGATRTRPRADAVEKRG